MLSTFVRGRRNRTDDGGTLSSERARSYRETLTFFFFLEKCRIRTTERGRLVQGTIFRIPAKCVCITKNNVERSTKIIVWLKIVSSTSKYFDFTNTFPPSCPFVQTYPNAFSFSNKRLGLVRTFRKRPTTNFRLYRRPISQKTRRLTYEIRFRNVFNLTRTIDERYRF